MVNGQQQQQPNTPGVMQAPQGPNAGFVDSPTNPQQQTPFAGTSNVAPPATDAFTNAAAAQGQQSQANVNQQTVANRANQVNPFGSSSWTQDPNTGQWTQNVALAGAQGDALTAQQNLQAGRSEAASSLLPSATSALGKGLDTSGLNPLFSFGAPGQTNQQAQDAVMGQLQPQLDVRRKAAETQLANQGITPGSEAWQNTEDQLARDENNARLQGVQAGFTQGNTENSQNINYANEQQQQNMGNLQQQELLRSQPLTDINALTSGQSVANPTFGTYGQAGVAQTPNYLGAGQSSYNTVLDSQNASADQQASLYRGLFGLGGAFLGSPAGGSAVNAGGDWLGQLFGLGGG